MGNQMSQEPEDRGTGPIRPGQVVAGLIVLFVGAFALMDGSGAISDHVARMVPGMVLIALGVAQLAWHVWPERPGRRRRSFAGFWLILIGAWLLVNATHAFGFTALTSWPLLVIGIGVLLVLRALFPGRCCRACSQENG